MAVKHGMYGTPTYQSWADMKSRCTNDNTKSYKDYGGRGITYDLRWNAFENFLSDMGERPKGTTLDRTNNEGNYEPSNCKWATKKEQANNRRTSKYITWDGKTQTVSQWENELKISGGTLRVRLDRGWDLERAFCKSTKQKKYKVNGMSKTITGWAKYLNVDRHTLYSRLRRGWTIKRTLSN